MRALASILLALLLPGCISGYQTHEAPAPQTSEPAPSPYVGQETRPIKALSPEDVEGLRAGKGLGYAKSAELNHYPGPLHALELADELELTAAQRATMEALREEMLARVIPLGEALLQAEADVEEAFRAGDVTSEELARLLDEAARREAAVRFVHLDTHIATRDAMTPEQVAKYDQLRGYASGSGHGAHGSGHGHGGH